MIDYQSRYVEVSGATLPLGWKNAPEEVENRSVFAMISTLPATQDGVPAALSAAGPRIGSAGPRGSRGPAAAVAARALPVDQVDEETLARARGIEAGDETAKGRAEHGGDGKTNSRGLTEEELQLVAEMTKRDAEVRRHEQAHARVGGPYSGLPVYEYERAPDGRLYAVSGEVTIDTGRGHDPEETVRKMEIVVRAALAPADPSAQDRAVANQARRIKTEAEGDLRKGKEEEILEAIERRRARDSGEPTAVIGSIAPVAAVDAYLQTAGIGPETHTEARQSLVI